jgi:DNA excision repair protein ERCC-3
MALRDAGQLRPYQQRSLAKMFGNGRARSGIIVLPCGAGKTLVGIAASATLGKSTIVLCPNQTSVLQWVESFVRFTDVKRSSLVTLLARNKQPLPPLHEAVIVLTTYSMIGSGGRAKESAAVLRDIAAREWGLLLLDEVHQAVANTFSRVLRLRAHTRLGLTATLVREDGRDRNLSHLIGPKLYEANWRDLTRAGYLANVQVVEVRRRGGGGFGDGGSVGGKVRR